MQIDHQKTHRLGERLSPTSSDALMKSHRPIRAVSLHMEQLARVEEVEDLAGEGHQVAETAHKSRSPGLHDHAVHESTSAPCTGGGPNKLAKTNRS